MVPPLDSTQFNSDVAAATRVDGRQPDQLRPLQFRNHVAGQALGSTLIQWGNTHVICAVMVEDVVPRWMKDQGVTGGWITAEYSMLPYSTLQRKQRESTRGKVEGRTQEIQRLIGRAMRAAVDLELLGTRTVWIDCDVLQADGGTRTAAITGSYVALNIAMSKLVKGGSLPKNPVTTPVAAVSVGIVSGRTLVDLCYAEDSTAEVDMNLVMDANGRFIELQGTGERSSFTEEQLGQLLAYGKKGIQELLHAQAEALTSSL